MKKLLSAVPMTILATLLCLTPAYATEDVVDVPMDSPEDVAIAFLSDATENMYLYTENDLDVYSINSLPVAVDNQLESMTYSVDGKSIALSDFLENMTLVNNKVSYYKYIRSSQDFVVNDFTQTYTVDDVQKFDNTATVNITELLTWQYADYDLPSAARIHYNVIMVNDGTRWRVAEVIAPEEVFDQQYIIGNKPFSLSTEISAFDEATLAEQEYLDNLQTQGLLSANQQTPGAKSGYDIEAAVAYARKWAMDRNSPPFLDFASDCMNFASQCVYVGLGGSSSSHDTNYMDTTGSNTWYWNDYDAWVSCEDFRDYIESSDAQLVTEHTQTTGDLPVWYPGEWTGSVAHVEGRDGPLAHAIFITDSASPTRKDMYFCAHTTDRLNERVSAYYPTGDMYFISPQYLE